jgi:transposase-like protein
MANKPVFEVAFKCNNCGHTWANKFEANDRVKTEGIIYPKVVVYMKERHSLDTGDIYTIVCPICNADDIQVLSRIPLKDKLGPQK